jgi:hypothetical protein
MSPELKHQWLNLEYEQVNKNLSDEEESQRSALDEGASMLKSS